MIGGDPHGRPTPSEVDLIEPSLFPRQSPAAGDRLVAAIARAVSLRAS
jgi:hypothetical protein